MKIARQLTLMLAAAACLATQAARADAAPRSYALMSLAGDAISTVVENPSIGSNMDKNERQVFPIADKVFDVAAIEAANEAIKKADPQAKTALLVTPDPGLYKAQNSMFESPAQHGDDRTFLKSLLTNRTVSHLILVTKLRADASVWLADTMISTGRLEGLGFYMNNQIRVQSNETLNATSGVLAPFAYVKLRLIDAATMEVVKEVVAKHANPLANFGGTTASWGALSNAQKIECLSAAYQEAVSKAIPRLLQ